MNIANFDHLQTYVSNVLKDDVLLLIELETEVWARIRALGLEETVAEYATWNPYVQDYVFELIGVFTSTSDCLISLLRIILSKKGDFSHSCISL